MPRGIPNKPRTLSAGPDGGQQPAAEPKNTRAEAVRSERRRRPGSASNAGLRLALDESKLDRNTYNYRHVRDEGNRVPQLEAQDWDIVRDSGVKPDSTSMGSTATTHGGTDEGKPYGLVLMRKRKDWFEADQKEKQRPLEEIDQAIRRGNPQHKGNELRGSGVYTPGADEQNPSGVNIIESVR